jgi:hypothetical protein
LATTIAADRCDEAGGFDLRRQCKREGRVKFVGAVCRKAERRAAPRARNGCDGGRIGSEMGVEMLDLQLVQTPKQPGRFESISQMTYFRL